jgi:AraC family transcriptional regulator
MASSDGAYGEVELRPSCKFADPRLSAMVAAVDAEMVAGFPSGRLFLDSVEQAMAVALVNGHAVRHRPVQIYQGGPGQRACEGLKSWSMRRWKTSLLVLRCLRNGLSLTDLE